MAGKEEVSAVVAKAFKSFQMFSVPDGESGQSCGVLELEGHLYGAWLDSERQVNLIRCKRKIPAGKSPGGD